MAALFGKALAAQVSDATTGNQSRRMYGALAGAIANAYGTLNAYQWDSRTQAMVLSVASGGAAAVIYGLSPDVVAPAREYLDGVNEMIQGYYANTFEDDAAMTDLLLAQLRASVSAVSVAVKTIDDLYSTSWLSELCDAIVDAVGTVGAKVAGAVSHLAGSFVGEFWWEILLGAAVLVFVSRYKRGAL